MNRSVIFIDETAQLGGAEINLLTIASGLKARGWQPQVIVAEPGPLVELLQKRSIPCTVVRGCPRMRVSFYIRQRIKIPNPAAMIINLIGGLVWIFRLWRVLKDQHCQIVHTNSLKAHLFGGLAGQLAGLKVVWHYQDIVEGRSGWNIYRKILWFFARICADRILCISPQVVSQFAANPSLKKRTFLLWNTIDTQKFAPALHKVPVSMHSTGLRIGTVARIIPWKGQEVALRAARWLKEQSISFYWVFAGDVALGSEAYFDHLKKLIVAWDLTDCVEFTGWVSDMPAFYHSLDILVHIPIKPEPFGLTIVEAMACGVPVIATPGGAADHFVQPGGGWLVESDRAKEVAEILREIWQSPEELTGRSSQAIKFVSENFSINRYLNQLEDLYQSL